MSEVSSSDKKLFWACFIALVATSFVFGMRANIIGTWATEFGLTETQKGEILGVGLWPFAFSMILFSLIIDKIGYKTSAYIAIVLHVGSIILTISAKSYAGLFWGSFMVAVANGIIEAFINPITATIFSKEKSKWLNILHAGWPMGLALGALVPTILPSTVPWRIMFGVILVPVIAYTVLLIPRKFPVQERVAAGVSYREMLRQVGGVGFFIIGVLGVMGIQSVIGMQINLWISLGGGALLAIAAGLYTGSLGSPMFIIILITMGPLATTELGTDSWMPELLQGSGISATVAGWTFIYISTLMTILRFYAGPIVHKFSSIGLLVLSSIVAIIGLMFLWKAAGIVILVAATVYAFGKTFFWSTTLGLVSEQFPKGGAICLNSVSAVGVMGMGLIGAPLMGNFQDVNIDKALKNDHAAIHEQVKGPIKDTMFGKVPAIDQAKVETLSDADKKTTRDLMNDEKRATFARVAVLPGFMLLCYLGIFFYFKSKGGYKPEEI